MNNTNAAPAGHFPLFDHEQQEEDRTYFRESHTLTRIGPRRPPLPPPFPPTHVHHDTLATANRQDNISRPFSTPSKQQQQDSIQSRERHALMTKTFSPPPPPIPAPRNADSRLPPSLLSPSNGRADSAERSTSHQPNHRILHNTHKSHRITKHAQTHAPSTVRRLTRQEEHEAFFVLCFLSSS